MIDGLEDWCSKFQNTNVYRTLKITSLRRGVEEIIGPFVIDIDNEDEDLEDALSVTRKTLSLLRREFGIEAKSIRMFFTGHKGFNFEICPEALGIRGSMLDQVRKSAEVLYRITEALKGGKSFQCRNQISDKGTIVDETYGDKRSIRIKHRYIRLHNSLNMWYSSEWKIKTRMKIELTFDELAKSSATEIAHRAEIMAT